ncbi:hypothetical protein [Spirosoma aerolatum]|uniref:hypothetical protein n=1 Tax=Spirosoma aerolatum TaxID=1211326 RepID=UPI0012D33642|nr:hypothetical protein [Spirosoma aerolatum]
MADLPPLPSSSTVNKLLKWEDMPLSSLLSVLTKWFNCDYFTLTVDSRPRVETGIWYTLKFELPERYGHESKRTRFLSASSLELMKERLIKCLDRDRLCEERLKKQA